jgi:hypothetical protein
MAQVKEPAALSLHRAFAAQFPLSASAFLFAAGYSV